MDYYKLGQYIQSKRKSAGVSLNRFAMANDIEPAILSRIENGQQGIKVRILEKIAKGFKQTPAEFLHEFENYNNAK